MVGSGATYFFHSQAEYDVCLKFTSHEVDGCILTCYSFCFKGIYWAMALYTW